MFDQSINPFASDVRSADLSDAQIEQVGGRSDCRVDAIDGDTCEGLKFRLIGAQDVDGP